MQIAYVSCELSSSITVFCIDDTMNEKIKCRLSVIQDIDTDKDMEIDQDIWKRNYVAEIGISNDGKFVYCSNRGYDTLAVFKVLTDGKLQSVSYVTTYGKTPRHFSITPDDKYLIVANQDSNNLVVFKRDLENGALSLIKKYENIIAAPNYVLLSPFNISNVSQNRIKQGSSSSNKSIEMLIWSCSILPILIFIGLFFFSI